MEASAVKKLSELYYRPGASQAASRLLEALRKDYPLARLQEVKNWLSAQQAEQIHRAPPTAPRRFQHFHAAHPNDIHQADLLFLPQDKDGSKYALVVVDVASRYRDARPLKDKTAVAVVNGFRRMYKEGPLKWPKTLMVDAGGEFKGHNAKVFKDGGTKVQVAPPAKQAGHRSQSLAEAANKQIAIALFRLQEYKELKNGQVNKDWVDDLPAVLHALNERVNKATGQVPAKAVKEKVVHEPTEKESDASIMKRLMETERSFPEGSTVRRRLRLHDYEGERKRATDPTFSAETYTVGRMVARAGEPVYIYLQGKGAPKYGLRTDELERVEKIQPPPVREEKKAQPKRPAPKKQKIVRGRTERGRTVRLPGRFQ